MRKKICIVHLLCRVYLSVSQHWLWPADCDWLCCSLRTPPGPHPELHSQARSRPFNTLDLINSAVLREQVRPLWSAALRTALVKSVKQPCTAENDSKGSKSETLMYDWQLYSLQEEQLQALECMFFKFPSISKWDTHRPEPKWWWKRTNVNCWIKSGFSGHAGQEF